MSNFETNLRNDIEYCKKDIEALNTVLRSVDEQIALLGDASATSHLRHKIVDSLNNVKRHMEEKEEKLAILKGISRTNTIQVMYFKAWHHSFHSEQWENIQKDLRKFPKTPYLKRINSGSSDEGILYASEDIEANEAQIIWDYIKEFQDDYENDTIHWEWGNLLHWDGEKVFK